ncbi:hypothetical protein B484DRAFT_468566, partial [Ochromonadaceae sp. CCMP2298]
MARTSNDRLGPYRRNKRDYSVKQRHTGKVVGDRMREKRLVKLACYSALAASLNLDAAFKASLLQWVVVFVVLLLRIRRPRLCTPDPIVRRVIDFSSFTTQEYELHFGFSRAEVEELFVAMRIPDWFTLNDGRHRFRVTGVHAFLYTLYRYHSPSQRQTLDEVKFGYDYSVLSKMFAACINFMDEEHAHLYRNLPRAAAKFETFRAKITAKHHVLWPGEALPPDAARCVLFGDGSRFEVSAPAGPWWRQHTCFSGDKWYHCSGAQGIFGPDGIFYDWYDEPLGRDSDRFFMRDSMV